MPGKYDSVDDFDKMIIDMADAAGGFGQSSNSPFQINLNRMQNYAAKRRQKTVKPPTIPENSIDKFLNKGGL